MKIRTGVFLLCLTAIVIALGPCVMYVIDHTVAGFAAFKPQLTSASKMDIINLMRHKMTTATKERIMNVGPDFEKAGNFKHRLDDYFGMSRTLRVSGNLRGGIIHACTGALADQKSNP